MDSIVAIIPARGGSKRIPRKNILPFAGKPIIGYSIEAALKCNLFDRVIVSTDDEEISALSRKFGAETPFLRPRELTDDFTGTNDVIKHCLHWLHNSGYSVHIACCIYATAPFIRTKYLRKGYELLQSSGKSFAFSVTSFPFPVQRAIRINKKGTVEAIFPNNNLVRSQDLEEAYHDAGQFYWFDVKNFLKQKQLYTPDAVPIIIPRFLVQDIDSQEDWDTAEKMYQIVSSKKNI